ncbi:hypothetical protein IWW38_001507 [Coemansia aciculifera]|uniref:Uncharacterized protein n=1 Tax=Coemansia aciculifera TaxID=417176 RepID=A0ACC1M7T0_9FUNG|nr:hypothetical protein IWW38_001507 [Coemansia aciculifera]
MHVGAGMTGAGVDGTGSILGDSGGWFAIGEVIIIERTGTTGAGIDGEGITEGAGIIGDGTTGAGIIGDGTTGAGIIGDVMTGAGIDGDGIMGEGTTGAGIIGDVMTGAGIEGEGTIGAGMEEVGIMGAGIEGEGTIGAGVVGAGIIGEGTTGAGIMGVDIDGAGIEGEGTIGAGIEEEGTEGGGITGAGIDGQFLVYLGPPAVEAFGVAIGAVEAIEGVADAVGTGVAMRWSAHPGPPPGPLIAASGQAVAPSSKLPKSAGSRARSWKSPPLTGMAALSAAEMSESVMNLTIPTIVCSLTTRR